MCENCNSETTPQWRKGWYNTVLNKTVSLCNACGIKYAKNQFCTCMNFFHFLYDSLPSATHFDTSHATFFSFISRKDTNFVVDCYKIYGKEHGQHHAPEHWLTCSTCARWIHIDCEKRAWQFHHNVPTFVNSITGEVDVSAYQCPDCYSQQPKKQAKKPLSRM